jgi:FKBP-type peptidyl-prolyl cis-trans isomerase (trigger factor)
MRVEQLNCDNGRTVLGVEVDWEEIAPDYNALVAEYAKQPTPGFRPGKVPLPIVESRYRKRIIEDLFERRAPRLGKAAVAQSGARAAGPLELVDPDCTRGAPLRFKVRFIALPQFELPGFEQLQLPDDCDDPLSTLSHRLLELVEMERPGALVKAELALDGEPAAAPGSDAWNAAADRVKLMLILKQYADREGIVVDDSDVDNRIEAKAAEFGTSVAALRAELSKDRGMERLRDVLIAESTLEYLLDRVRQ